GQIQFILPSMIEGRDGFSIRLIPRIRLDRFLPLLHEIFDGHYIGTPVGGVFRVFGTRATTKQRVAVVVFKSKQKSKTKSRRRKPLKKLDLRTVSMLGLSVVVCPVYRECRPEVCPDYL